jgi:hypothetical protein
MTIDEAKFQEFLRKMLNDAGAAMGIGLVLLGDKYGLYKALSAAGPLTSAELASRTGTAARYVREWAAAQAAAGYINFDAATERFSIHLSRRWSSPTRMDPHFFRRRLRDCWRNQVAIALEHRSRSALKTPSPKSELPRAWGRSVSETLAPVAQSASSTRARGAIPFSNSAASGSFRMRSSASRLRPLRE